MLDEQSEFRPSRTTLRKSKIYSAVKNILAEIEEHDSSLKELLEDSEAIGILNRVEINKLLNIHLTNTFKSINESQQISEKVLKLIINKKDIVSPKDSVKLYIKMKELENDHLKLIRDFCAAQEVKLEQPEQDILIIYRSLPDHLKELLYRTIMEFVRKCPAIQREITKSEQPNQE